MERRFAPISKHQLRTLCDKLLTLKKKIDESIDDYLLNAKTIVDSMAFAGNPIPNHELLDYITNGLGYEYRNFITSLNFHLAATFDEYYELLLQEAFLTERLNPSTVDPNQALLATTSSAG